MTRKEIEDRMTLPVLNLCLGAENKGGVEIPPHCEIH